MRRPGKLLRAALGVLLGSVVLTGCDFDVYSLPLPGGADVGKDPIEVTVQFRDVLDLVPKSSVKVNDVTVGQVTDVKLDGYTADVTLELRDDTLLPDNALAEIRQTSLLGEKFVSLSAPTTGASSEPLSSGDVIPLDRSGRNPEVEEVLGALSLLLNGGGVAQLKTITQELNKAVGGREDDVRSVLQQLDTFTGTLDDNKADIVDAIDSLNQLSISVRQQQGNINAALDELPSALRSIDGQRKDLVKMLKALNELGDVGVRVIQASKTGTVDSLTQLMPVLNQLAASGDDLVNAFNVFLTYPFVDEVVGRDPQVARNLHMGDYTNLSVQLQLDLTKGLPTIGIPTEAVCTPLSQIPDLGPLPPLNELCAGAIQAINNCQAKPSLENCSQLPQFLINQVCQALPIPVLCPGAGSSASPGLPLPSISLPPLLPSLGASSGGGLLDPLLGGLGLRSANRAAPWPSAARGGPTMGQLQEVYDPDLVNLLVPSFVADETSTGATAQTKTKTKAASSRTGAAQ